MLDSFMTKVEFDGCMYGASSRCRTTIVGHLPDSDQLSIHCDHLGYHPQVASGVRGPGLPILSSPAFNEVLACLIADGMLGVCRVAGR